MDNNTNQQPISGISTAGLVGISDWLDKQFEEARKLAERSIPAAARDAS